MVLLDALASPERGVDIAKRIRATFDLPFLLPDAPIRISASIGVATFPTDGEDAEQLARAADRAMYCAKQAGGNQTRTAGDADVAGAAGNRRPCDADPSRPPATAAPSPCPPPRTRTRR